MKYKVGDKVLVRSKEWYDNNKSRYNDIECGNYMFYGKMSYWCGKVVNIQDVYDGFYRIREDGNVFKWTDEMFEGLAEEETKPKYEDEVNGEYHSTPQYLVRPSGYQFVDENGNVINAQKIVLEKKKKEYPKTYEECCKILGLNSEITDSELLFYYPLKCGDYTTIRLPEMEKFEKFIQLYLCRNAYWKIAGEEMGLGKPWEPDWNIRGYYAIARSYGNVVKTSNYNCDLTFVFPTEEMRDAFYENFKELIESVKELL